MNDLMEQALEAVKKKLSACLLTDKEYEEGPEKWASHPDPIHPWEVEEEEGIEENELQ